MRIERSRVRPIRAPALIGRMLLVLCCMAWPAAVQAQSRIWFASAHHESPGLVVPIVFVTSTGEERDWSLGVAGWTISVDWKRSLQERRRVHLFSRITPLNAHSSNYIYRSGRRDDAAEYRNASLEAGGGLELAHRPAWTGGYRVVVLHELVDRLPAEVAEYWDRPFAGFEVTQRYSRVSSDELFGSRWQGVKAGLDAQLFTGARTWTRFQVTAGAGGRTGRLFLSGRAAAFAGHSLNDVSAFLIGGSWDLPLPGMLAGYRYAEFRLRRAAVFTGTVDARLAGRWEVGGRGSCLATHDREACGVALQLMAVSHGAVISAGAAFPVNAGVGSRPVLFASVAVALVDP